MPGKSEFTVHAVPVLDGHCILAAFMLNTKRTYAVAISAYIHCIGLGPITFSWKFSSGLNLPLFKC